MEKYTLTQAIEALENLASNPSILTGSTYRIEDVIAILKSIDIPEAKPREVQIPDQWFDLFLDHLCEGLDDDELIDYDSAEFEIKYGNDLRLNRVILDTHNLKRQLKRNLADAMDEVSAEMAYEEDREAERAKEASEQEQTDKTEGHE
jgi:hypothetical protein